MRRISVQRIGSCIAGILGFARIAFADPLDPGTTMCLHVPELPTANAATDRRTADLQARLVKGLEAARFAVPDPAAVKGAIERATEQAEAVFDPYTGRRDPQRTTARRAAIAQALRAELRCQVQMVAEVRPVYAHFAGGVAYWDRTSEHVSSDGRMVMNGIAGVSEYGFVPALSLWLRVFDLDGEEIAFRSAGIETLVNFAVVKDRDLLPEDRWLTDGAKIDSAIASALGSGGSGLRLEGNPHWKPPSP